MTLQTTTSNGITCTNNGDGTYTLNGTATANTYFDLCRFNVEASKTYKIVGCASGGSSSTYQLYLEGHLNGTLNWLSDYGNGASGQRDAENVLIRIRIGSGTVCNNLLFKPMITTDTSATYNDYEPFGIIQPSGDVTSHSKNLLNPNTQYVGQYDSSGNFNTETRRLTSDYVAIKPNTDYMATVDVNSKHNLSLINYNYFDSNFRWLGNRSTNGDAGFSGAKTKLINISDSSVAYIKITYRGADSVDTVISNYSLKDCEVSLEVGTNATDYVPFGSSTVHTDRPLLSVNDIKNELIVNADGSGKFVQRVGIVDLGTLTWTVLKTKNDKNRFNSKGIQYLVKRPSTYTEISNIISDKYNAITGNDPNNEVEGITIRPDGSVMIYDSALDTVNESAFKVAMNGIRLVYELETETENDLTQTEVNALLSLQTFENETYVDADGCEFEIKYNLYEPFDTIYNEVTETSKKADELIQNFDSLNTINNLAFSYATDVIDQLGRTKVYKIGKMVLVNLNFHISSQAASSKQLLLSLPKCSIYGASGSVSSDSNTVRIRILENTTYITSESTVPIGWYNGQLIYFTE